LATPSDCIAESLTVKARR